MVTPPAPAPPTEHRQDEPKWDHERHRTLWRLIADRLKEGRDLSHDHHHVLRVYRWALRLAADGYACPDLAGAAALVHDLVAIPKDDAARPLAGQLSAEAAGKLLEPAGYVPDEIHAIAEAVRTSNWSSGLPPAGPLGQVLQDADRLDAIGAVGIVRTFVCAQTMASGNEQLRLYDPADPCGSGGRPPDDQVNAVDHFAVKLLRLAAGMHTPTAQAEAQRRHAVMVDFLAQLERELIE